MMNRKSLLYWAVLGCFLFSFFFPSILSNYISIKEASEFYSIHSAKAAEAEDNRITLAQLAAAAGQPAQFTALQSPMDHLSFRFSLPLDWKVEEEAKLDLSLTSLIASMMPSQGEINYEQIVGGILSITINGQTIEAIPIQGNGKKNFSIQLPAAVWQNSSEEHIHTLELQWDANLSCNYNLIATIAIDPQSTLWLPHQLNPLELDISQFPAPFLVENALFPHPTTMIIPPQPTAGELEAAFSIGGGLEQFSHSSIKLELVNSEEITPQQLSQNHLIIIGHAWQTPQLEEKLSPLLQVMPSGKEAVLHLVPSPWNKGRGVLLLQGQDDESLIKGAHAASRGILMASQSKAVSVIHQEQEGKSAAIFTEDTTFSALGIKDTTITHFGSTTIQIPLNIPPEVKIGAEAYLDLVFNHSQVADYLRSAIVVRLNRIPIGSVRFSDSTAGLSTLRSMLPPTIIRPGQNELQVQVDLYPRQICSDERLENLWVTIFSNSFLHLPTVKEASPIAATPLLGGYSSLFSSPEQNLILLPKNRPSAYQAAFQFSQALAINSSVGYRSPTVFYADSADFSLSPEKHLLFVGLPQDFPQLTQWQAFIPADFTTENVPGPIVQQYIPFKISPKVTLGYLSLGQMGNQHLLLILGNNSAGLNNAIKALLNPKNQDMLNNGNFAVVQESKVIVVNLPLGTPQQPELQGEAGKIETTGEKTEELFADSIRQGISESGIAYNQPEPWLLPAIIASSFLIVLILGYKIISSFSQTSKKQRL